MHSQQTIFNIQMLSFLFIWLHIPIILKKKGTNQLKIRIKCKQKTGLIQMFQQILILTTVLSGMVWQFKVQNQIIQVKCSQFNKKNNIII